MSFFPQSDISSQVINLTFSCSYRTHANFCLSFIQDNQFTIRYHNISVNFGRLRSQLVIDIGGPLQLSHTEADDVVLSLCLPGAILTDVLLDGVSTLLLYSCDDLLLSRYKLCRSPCCTLLSRRSLRSDELSLSA